MTNVVIPLVRSTRRTARQEAQVQQYIEYKKWRDLIKDEIAIQKAKGVTYKQISARTGLCVTTISKLASKETVLPRMDTVYRVLKFLGFTLYASR